MANSPICIRSRALATCLAMALNGSDYCAVKLKSDEVMTIGYLVRRGVTISPLGQKYLEEISRYKDKALR